MLSFVIWFLWTCHILLYVSIMVQCSLQQKVSFSTRWNDLFYNFQHNYVVKMEVAKPIIYKSQVEKDIFCCLMVVVNFLSWSIGCLSFLSFFFVTCAFKSSTSHCTWHCRLNYRSNFVMGWNKHVNNFYHL
jgi:hypothetical protein